MITFLIGILAIIILFLLVVILGIIPNLWSNRIISITDIWGLVERGMKSIVIFLFTFLFGIAIYGIGLIIKQL